jgi:cell division protein FtsL
MTRLIQDQASSVVRERDRRRLRAMAGALGLGCVLVSGVLGYVWLQVHRVRVSYELEDLRSLRGDVEQQNRKLRLELLSLRSYARVDSAARQLGLREPGPDQVRLAREFLTREPDETATAMADTARGGPKGPGGTGAEAVHRR